jgi:hypothetical protein
MAIVTSLPRVVAVTEIHDAGPGGASCPHCGAIGRYVIGFVTEDGEKGGAMRGCWKLFPKGEFVELTYQLIQKQMDADEKGKKLATWDNEMLAALDGLENGRIGPDAARETIRQALLRKKNWMKSRGYRR